LTHTSACSTIERMHFKDKVIWITGASSGIGAMLATKLAQQQAILILTARNIDALQVVQKECLSYTPDCQILPANLVNDDLQSLVNKAISLFGHVDVLINNAGITQRSLAIETSIDVYRQLMEIDYFVPVSITKYLMPHFIARTSGHVIAISSMAGLMGFPMRSGYSAAKHALNGFFETLQVENTIPALYFTIISPGRINTPISLSALTANGIPYNKMDEGQLNGIPVAKCADKILNAIKHKKKHIIIAREERILLWLWWFLPALYYRIAQKAGLKN